MDLELRGKKVLITGASQGIGEGLAEIFAEEGCNLHLVARASDKLKAISERLQKAHGVDITIQSQDMGARGAADAIGKACPRVDVLINNAGDVPAGNLWQVTPEAWRQGFEVKVFGYIDLCRIYYADMKAAGGGVILNNMGIGGELMDFRYIAGTTGNAALMAFTRALGGRSMDDNIRVVGINPGPVLTPRLIKIMKIRAKERWNDESRYPELLSGYPLGRAASVRECCELFAFLASKRAVYISGTIVTLDGGVATRHSVSIEPKA